MDKIDKQYTEKENLWDQQWPTGNADTQTHPSDEMDTAGVLSPFPDEVGTGDAIEAVRDAQPYAPPLDPPVLPGGRDRIHVATGFGQSSEDLTMGKAIPSGDEDIRDTVLRAIHNDSLGSQLQIDVHVRNRIVHLSGRVQSIEDVDHITSVIDRLPGVDDVVDDTTVESATT